MLKNIDIEHIHELIKISEKLKKIVTKIESVELARINDDILKEIELMKKGDYDNGVSK